MFLALVVIGLVVAVLAQSVIICRRTRQRDFWARAFLSGTLTPPDLPVDDLLNLLQMTDLNKERKT